MSNSITVQVLSRKNSKKSQCAKLGRRPGRRNGIWVLIKRSFSDFDGLL